MQADARSELAAGPKPSHGGNPMAQSDYATSAIPAPITGANAKPSTNPVRATYAGLLLA